MQFLTDVLNAIPSAHIPFLIIISLVTLILWRAHFSTESPFSVNHMIINSVTGKGSVEKVLVLLAGLSVTWWFMDLSALHKATWSDAVAYGGLLGLAKIADKALDIKSGVKPVEHKPEPEKGTE